MLKLICEFCRREHLLPVEGAFFNTGPKKVPISIGFVTFKLYDYSCSFSIMKFYLSLQLPTFSNINGTFFFGFYGLDCYEVWLIKFNF